MDHIKWYHKTCAECVKHGLKSALFRREERIWQQLTDARKCLQVPVRGMLETAAKKIKIVKPRDNVMVPVPDLGRAKIDAHSLRHPEGV